MLLLQLIFDLFDMFVGLCVCVEGGGVYSQGSCFGKVVLLYVFGICCVSSIMI